MDENTDICGEKKEDSLKPDDLRCLPDFATLCSFLTFFGSDLGIHLTFPQLYDFLCLQDSANTKIWETLHVKLLNKLKYRARPDRWEPVLGRFLLNHGLHIDGIETAADILLSTEYVNDDKANFIAREPVGHLPSSYYRLSPSIRTRTLLCLLETQFDRNQPFKDKANLRSPIDLRFPPLGIDVWGRSYWLLKDSDVNIYLYREDHHDNSFMLLCESFDEIRDLIEELKGAYSEDEKLEDILKKRQLPTDKEDLKDQLTTLIQEGIASPEHQNLENCENNDLSASTLDVGLKPTATPPPTPAFPHVPTLHSVDLLLATSKVEQFIKAENRDNEAEEKEEEEKGSPEMVSTVQTDEKGDDKMETQVNEAKQSDLHTSEEYHIKPECIEDGVLRPDDNNDDDCDTKVTENPQTSTVEESTCVMSNNKMKKSRKQNSNKNYPESSISEQQDLRRSSRQRKPVQVFIIEPTQSKRVKTSSTPVTESLSKSTNEDGDGNSKKKKIPEDASAAAAAAAVKHHVLQKKKRKKKKRHRKKSRKGSNPWNNETSSSDSDAEEDDSFEKALMQHLDADSDDSISHSKAKANKRVSAEWSDAPESDFDPNGLDVLSDVDSVTDGRNLARQKRLQKKFISDTDNTLNEIDKEEPCQVCFKSHMPDWMLLCDRCDLGHHAMCLSPPLYIIPEGDWFCPRCQHTALISSLNETVTALEAESKKRNIWKRMQERLNFVNISMTNIIGDDDSDCADGRKVKKGKVLRNIQSNNVNYALDHSSSDQESKDANSDSNSDAESVEYNTDSGVDGRSQKGSTRHPRLRQRRNIQYSMSRRVKFREETSDEDTESSESEAESIPCRTTRQRQVKYKLSDAFKQLDEALEADEKYQAEKQRRLKRKANQNSNESGGEAVDEEECETNSHPPGRSRGKDLSNILGPEWKESEDKNRKRRRDKFSSSSSSEQSADEDKIYGRNRKASDEDFNPSSSEELESEDEADDYRGHHSSEDQLSSDNSWLCTARRSGRSSRKNASKRRKLCNYPRRSRRPVPHFEDSDECSDRKATRSRRCTRNVVSYRESNDEESSDDNNNNNAMQGTSEVVTPNKSKPIRRVLDEDDDEEDNDGDNIKENNTTDNQPPSPITVSLKRTHGNRKILKSSSSSDSEYKPFDDDDDDGEEEEGEEEEDEEEEEGNGTASDDDSNQFNKPNNLKSIVKSNKSNSLNIIIKSELSDEIINNSDDHDHQLKSPELVISETSDIDNSLFKDHVVKSPTTVTATTTNSTNTATPTSTTTAIVSECYKTEETGEDIKMMNLLSSSPKNYSLNGQCNNLTTMITATTASNDDEEVEDEVDECLPNRNFHVSHLFDKNTIDDNNDSKTCVSPDLF